MSQSALFLSSGLVEFNSIDDLRRYVRQLQDYYQREVDRDSETLGGLMRVQESIDKEKSTKKKEKKGKVVAKRWQKVGSILININDTNLGTIETMLGVLDEMRHKVARTTDALRSFEKIAELNIPSDSIFKMYLRDGVPQRMIIIENKPAGPSA